jgi:hypothetical protein
VGPSVVGRGWSPVPLFSEGRTHAAAPQDPPLFPLESLEQLAPAPSRPLADPQILRGAIWTCCWRPSFRRLPRIVIRLPANVGFCGQVSTRTTTTSTTACRCSRRPRGAACSLLAPRAALHTGTCTGTEPLHAGSAIHRQGMYQHQRAAESARARARAIVVLIVARLQDLHRATSC